MKLRSADFKTDQQRFVLLVAREYLRMKEMPLGMMVRAAGPQGALEAAFVPCRSMTDDERTILAEIDRVIAELAGVD